MFWWSRPKSKSTLGGRENAARGARRRTEAAPTLLPEERSGNLSTLERDLNKAAKCPAALNQVFIRSLVTIQGPTPPRIALRCVYRRDIGLNPDVFLHHIREMCCGNPEACVAKQKFDQRIVHT